jgi:hypothetical protein
MDKSLLPLKIKGYEDSCPICYEYWSTVAAAAPWVFPCGHMICESCYIKQRLINRTCHICREKYNLRKKKKNKKKHRNNISGTSSLDSRDSGPGLWEGWNGWDSWD